MESTSIELLHSVQLDMLIKFDKFCTENKLTYFLDSGTALGAVRHQGFIPWDDDVDIAMPRDDYNRLLEIGEKGLPDNLFLQTYKTDPVYMMPFAKIRLGDSFFPELVNGFEKMKFKGIYIDVFPFDRVPHEPLKASRYIKRSRFWYFVTVFSRRDYPGVKIPQKILSVLLHHAPLSIIQGLRSFYEKYCVKFNASDSDLMTCFCWRVSQKRVFLFHESELLPVKRIFFEGKELNIMQDAHSYLTKMFGDYYTLPPQEARKVHLAGPFRIN